MEFFLPVFFGCLVGLSLGLTGGGGSIFAIPLLVYGLGLSMTEAVPISLVAVALAAAVGAWYSFRAGLLIWQPIAMFSAGGVIGAPAGILVASYFDQYWLITGFAILVFIVGLLMLHKSFTRPEEAIAIRALAAVDDKQPFCKLTRDGKLKFTTPCALILMLTGTFTGLLSGLFGVGGGFLIVPVLMVVIELGIHRAVAASLVIISLIGLSGSSGALLKGELMLPVLIPFVVGSILGMLLGRVVAAHIAGVVLQRIFATGILVTGIGMLIHAVIILQGGLP